MSLIIIVLLIVANGVFAMSEIAVVSANKAQLRSQAEAGSRPAARALELAENPTRFLATVQVGITLIGVFAGAYGATTLARHPSPSGSPVYPGSPPTAAHSPWWGWSAASPTCRWLSAS